MSKECFKCSTKNGYFMRSQCLQLPTLSQSQEVKTQLHPASDQVLLRILLLNLLARLARPSGPASLGLSCSLDFCPDIGVVLWWSGFILNNERCQQIFTPPKKNPKKIIPTLPSASSELQVLPGKPLCSSPVEIINKIKLTFKS